MNKNIVYIFSHVPKTGGTTLRVHFQKHLKDQVEFIHLANKGDKWAKDKGLLPFKERTNEQRKPAKVILGHQVNFKTKYLVPHATVKEVVFFRNPVDWEKSRFNQFVNRRVNTGKSIINFKQWITSVEKTHSQFDWFLSNYLLLGRAVDILPAKIKENLLFYTLDNFSKVCLLQHFKQETSNIFDRLNIPKEATKENVAGIQKKKFYIASEENEELINKICYKDTLLFNKIKNFVTCYD